MKRVSQHLLFWLLFWLWSSSIVDWHNIATNCNKTFVSNLMYIARRLPLIIAATYILINYIVPKYLFEKKAPYLFAFIFSIYFIFINIIDRSFIAFLGTYNHWCSSTFWSTFFHYESVFRNALILIAVLGAATMIKFFKLLLTEVEKNKQLEVENLETKHAFLKSQVNPHFLFNALNNIYSLSVQSGHEKIASNISDLSGIMKYLTYESNNDFVALEKEVQLIKDYINIQQMRIDDADDVIIAFNIEGDYQDKVIAPVILLPLVENCFKHGIKFGEKSLINIKLVIDQNTLKFHTQNHHFPVRNNSIKEKGVGLTNVKKRLEMLYQKKHLFKKYLENNFFVTQLTLEIN